MKNTDLNFMFSIERNLYRRRIGIFSWLDGRRKWTSSCCCKSSCQFSTQISVHWRISPILSSQEKHIHSCFVCIVWSQVRVCVGQRNNLSCHYKIKTRSSVSPFLGHFWSCTNCVLFWIWNWISFDIFVWNKNTQIIDFTISLIFFQRFKFIVNLMKQNIKF